MLNDFFNNIGEIKGSGKSSYIDYDWYLLNPRIEIDSTGAFFNAKIKAKTEYLQSTKNVKGTVDVSYDQETNKIEVKIDTAKVILDVDVLGNNIVLTEIDIAKYFSKSLRLDGPRSIENEINYQLPSGEVRKMKVSNK